MLAAVTPPAVGGVVFDRVLMRAAWLNTNDIDDSAPLGKPFDLQKLSEARDLNNHALQYHNQGHMAEAESLSKRSFANVEKTFGPTTS